MSWNQHHSKSEEYASHAQLALRSGDTEKAKTLYRFAAEEEALALSEIDPNKAKTLGITAVSAASLWFKTGELRKAERIACQWITSEILPSFAVSQLQTVLQSVWNERSLQESGIKFSKGEVLVKVAGGEVVHGGAPLDLIHLKVDEVRSLFYRTIEMLLNIPLRLHGAPRTDIQQQFRPWLLQAPAGSYQFAVRVQKPAQMSLFPDASPDVEEVSRKVLEIIHAAAQEKSEILENSVSDPDYREVFLKLTRNLAPTGKTFQTLEMKSAPGAESLLVVLTPEARQVVNSALRFRKKEIKVKGEVREEQLIGVLRALHLDKDWIEIALSDDPRDHVQIYQTGDVIDDIVGPLVNHRVVVDVFVQPDGKRLFRDIQSEE